MMERSSGRGIGRAGWAWALYEGGRDPYLNLIVTFLFVPYFVRAVIGDPVRGQALLATTTTCYSLLVAFTAPLLGAVAEQYGARKPLLLTITALFVPAIGLLWFVRPSGSFPIWATLCLLGVNGILFAYSEVIHDAMLTSAVRREMAGRASGFAISLASLLSVAMLLFFLWAFVLPGSPVSAAWAFVPAKPLFGLDVTTYEPSRLVAPAAALLMLACSVPLFAFLSDTARTGRGLGETLRNSPKALAAIVRDVKGERDIAIFLVSRMLFADGMACIILFIGILATGVMHWSALQLLPFGVTLTGASVFGGALGGWADGRMGPKTSVRVEIAGATLCFLALLGTSSKTVLFFWNFASPPVLTWSGPIFRTLPEVTFLALSFWIAIFVSAHYASSRTLLTRLAPPAKLAGLFGLYALAGRATYWLGPMLIGVATTALRSQQAGFTPVAGLLLLGFIGMCCVKGGGREAPG